MARIVEKQFEPYMHEYADLEALMGRICGMIEGNGKRLPPKSVLEHYARWLGEKLNWLDIADQKLVQPLVDHDHYIDYTPAHTLRQALIDAINQKPTAQKAEARLRDVVIFNRDFHRKHANLIAQLERRKSRGLDIQTLVIGESMHKALQDNRWTQEQAAEHVQQNVGDGYPVGTIITYYHRWKKAQEQEIVINRN